MARERQPNADQSATSISPAPTAIVYCVPSEFALSRAERAAAGRPASPVESHSCGLTGWQESSLNTLSRYFLIYASTVTFSSKLILNIFLSVSDFCLNSACAALSFCGVEPRGSLTDGQCPDG